MCGSWSIKRENISFYQWESEWKVHVVDDSSRTLRSLNSQEMVRIKKPLRFWNLCRIIQIYTSFVGRKSLRCLVLNICLSKTNIPLIIIFLRRLHSCNTIAWGYAYDRRERNTIQNLENPVGSRIRAAHEINRTLHALKKFA